MSAHESEELRHGIYLCFGIAEHLLQVRICTLIAVIRSASGTQLIDDLPPLFRHTDIVVEVLGSKVRRHAVWMIALFEVWVGAQPPEEDVRSSARVIEYPDMFLGVLVRHHLRSTVLDGYSS